MDVGRFWRYLTPNFAFESLVVFQSFQCAYFDRRDCLVTASAPTLLPTPVSRGTTLAIP